MIRAAIIGCGNITERRHGPVLASLKGRVELAALADPSEERRSLVGAQVGVSPEHQYGDYQDMLAHESLDLVHVCTPHHWHEPQAIAAMQAGAHVVVEKPIATTLDEADRMIGAAQQYGRKLLPNHNQVFSAAARVAKEQLLAGAIGDPFLYRTEGFGGYNLHKGSGVDRSWRASAALSGGGPLIINGYHQVYNAVFFVGSPVKKVYARTGCYIQDTETEDMALLLMEHANGATTSLHLGWCAPGGTVSMDEILGTRGQLRLKLARGGVSLWQHDKGEWIDLPAPAEGPDEMGFPTLVEAFVRSIETDGPIPVAPEQGRHALAVVLAAYESGRTGQPVTLS
jgi:UDP-N-acetylglucosamine 3-dehydrogenase